MNNLVRGGILGGLIAVVLNVVIYFVTTSIGGVPLTIVDSAFSEVPLPAVIILTVAGTIGAVILLWILQRVSSRPIDLFLWIALIVGLLSFIPTWLATESRGAFMGLGLMHVAAAFGIVWGLLYSLRDSDLAQ